MGYGTDGTGYGSDETEDEFSSLDLGSESALEPATPDASPMSLSSFPISNAVKSAPPKDELAAYMPGKSSEVGMQIEGSFMDKVSSFLIGAGTKPGEINVNERLRLAQHAALRDEARLRIAAAHQTDTHATIAKSIEVANRRAITDGHAFFQNVQGRMQQMTPEERKVSAPIYKKLLGHFNTEFSELPDLMAQDLGNVLGLGSLINDPELKEDLTRISSGRPYAEVLKDPVIQRRVRMHGRETLGKIFTRIPDKALQELQAGKHDQGAFEKIFETAMRDESLNGAKPIDHAFAQTALLESDYGEEMMVGLGVKTNKLEQAKAKKEKDSGLAGQLKDEDLKHTKSILDFNETHPNMLPAQVVSEAKLRFDRHISVAAKEASPGQFSENNPLSPFLLSASKGKYKDPDTLLQGVQPGTAEYSNRLAMLDGAIAKRAESNPLGQNVAKLSMTHDSVAHPVYTMKKGRIERVDEPLTESAFRSMKGGFAMSPAQIEHSNKLDAAEIGGLQLFDQSAKAYKGKTKVERAKEVLAENVLTSAPGFFTDQARALAAEQYPEIAAYTARRDSVLGTYSKGLGGESGVLTDQDIARVRKLFDGAYDTPDTKKSKAKAFKQIIDLNRTSLVNILSSNKGTPSEGEALAGQWQAARAQHAATVNGILGSVEDKVRRTRQEDSASSLAEPAPGTTPAQGSRGESLLEKMRKGK